MSAWTKQDLENIAKLAKLAIPEKDIPARLQEFADILKYIEVLNQANIETTQANTQDHLSMYNDEVTTSLPIDEVLQNAVLSPKQNFESLEKREINRFLLLSSYRW